MSESNLKKNYFWNTLGTTLLSFNSLFLMIIVTRINGIADGGIFSFSFATAGIINFIALYFGRTYQVTDDNSIFSESVYVISRYATSIVAFMITILFTLICQYELSKSLVLIFLCLVKCLEAVSDIYYGIVQKKGKLYIAGKSLTYKSLLSLIGFIVIDLITKDIVICCLYLVVVNVLFIIFYDNYNAKKEIKIDYTFRYDVVKKLLKISVHTFLFTLIVMVIVNIPRYFIDWLLNNEEQGIYGIISMPATFIMLFAQFILQPSLVKLSVFYQDKNKGDFNKTVFTISVVILASLLLVLPVTYFLGIPVLELIYGVNLSAYRFLLILVVMGSDLYAVSNVLLNALIVVRCTKEQLVLQLIVLLVSTFSCYYLVSFFGIEGGIVSYFIILVLEFICYLGLYKVMVKRRFEV